MCGTDAAPGFIGIRGLGPDDVSGAAPFVPGAEVSAEIGATYVAVSPSCDFWSLSSVGTHGLPDGVLYQGRLTTNQVEAVDGLLRLEAWSTLGPEHGLCCIFDAGAASYHWGTRTLLWFGTPDPIGPPPLPEDFPADLTSLPVELHNLLSSYGTPAVGAVRFTVVQLLGTPLTGRPFEMAPPWPLGGSISEMSLTVLELEELQMQGLSPPVHRAEGEDGEALRMIRAAAIAGDFGNLESFGFTPIEEPDGSQYMLYLRDVGSFEMPEGVPARDPLSL